MNIYVVYLSISQFLRVTSWLVAGEPHGLLHPVSICGASLLVAKDGGGFLYVSVMCVVA